MRPKSWLVRLLLLIALAALLLFLRHHWIIDSCLDMGGRFDYQNKLCEYGDQRPSE